MNPINREKLEEMEPREALIFISMELVSIHDKLSDLDSKVESHYPCQDVSEIRGKMGKVLDTVAVARWLIWFIIPAVITALIKAFTG